LENRVTDVKSIIVTVLALIIKDGKTILVKRPNPPYKDFWGLPGGKVEFGESIPQAVLREAKEETGYDCQFENVCSVSSETIKDDACSNAAYHFILIVCRLKPISKQSEKTDEGETKWFSLSKIESLDNIIPSDRTYISLGVSEGNENVRFYEVSIRLSATECDIAKL
jgi:8-oxo-dGTP diphosphatase